MCGETCPVVKQDTYKQMVGSQNLWSPTLFQAWSQDGYDHTAKPQPVETFSNVPNLVPAILLYQSLGRTTIFIFLVKNRDKPHKLHEVARTYTETNTKGIPAPAAAIL